MMRFLIFAVVLMLLVTGGTMLDCHYCVSRRAGDDCELKAVTCPPSKETCAAVKFLRAPHGKFQKCMSKSDCEMLKINSYMEIVCCQKNFCNTF